MDAPLAQQLASSDQQTRDKAVARVETMLSIDSARNAFTEFKDKIYQTHSINCVTCAVQNVVFTTFATDDYYIDYAYRTAESVESHMRTCVCLVLPEKLNNISHKSYVRFLPIDTNQFAIDPMFCTRFKLNLYGWRMVSFLKTSALVIFLSQNKDIFIVDGDWIMQRPLPLPLPQSLDVVALPSWRHFFNVGLMFMRSTTITRSKSVLIANRTYAAWDQAIINEEIASSQADCGISNSLNRYFERNANGAHHSHVIRGSKNTVYECRNLTNWTVGPPAHSMYRTWDPFNYNGLGEAVVGLMAHRKTNRCFRHNLTLETFLRRAL